jgi:hypothetical protein
VGGQNVQALQLFIGFFRLHSVIHTAFILITFTCRNHSVKDRIGDYFRLHIKQWLYVPPIVVVAVAALAAHTGQGPLKRRKTQAREAELAVQ